MKTKMNEAQNVIVLVEDTEALRNAISNVLIQDKYHVEAFEDTDSAYAFLAMHKADLLITDVYLGPDNGLNLVERIEGLDLNVIVMTGHPTVEAVKRCMKAKVLEFLEKPVSVEVLRETVRRALSLNAAKNSADSEEDKILETSLRQGLRRNEFLFHYQPRLEVKTKNLNGAEALIRWQHPEKGFLMPGAFISQAEKSDVILSMGYWGLHQACLQHSLWREEGHGNIPIAVNLTVKQFDDKNLASYIQYCLRKYNVDPCYLEVEITEQVLASDVEGTKMIMNELHDLGILLALDDFGTGYSSLSYLKAFPFDIVKIDRSFISEISSDLKSCYIVRTIIEFARAMGMRTIAEGIETLRQFEILADLGCDEVQGYYFAKPMEPDSYAKYYNSKMEKIGVLI